MILLQVENEQWQDLLESLATGQEALQTELALIDAKLGDILSQVSTSNILLTQIRDYLSP